MTSLKKFFLIFLSAFTAPVITVSAQDLQKTADLIASSTALELQYATPHDSLDLAYQAEYWKSFATAVRTKSPDSLFLDKGSAIAYFTYLKKKSFQSYIKARDSRFDPDADAKKVIYSQRIDAYKLFLRYFKR